MSGFFGNFDLTDPLTLLRIACGAFFIPHIIGKFFVPAALEFFVAAGFKPAKTWMYVAGTVEVVLAAGLILGILVPFAAAIAALHLLVAAVAVYRVTGGKWLWNIGGCEYPTFWAISCIVVAMAAAT